MSAATLAARAGARPIRALGAVPPKLRRRLSIALATVLVLAAGYQLWLRDSSFVSVEDVTVTGLTTKDAARVRAQLISAARTMTTLHVEQDELERAIAAYPVVQGLEVHSDFPHGLAIHVVEHRPAGLVGGLPVAADGTILRGIPVEGRLPKIDARDALHGDRVTQPAALHAARVAGAAPDALRSRLERVEMRSEGGIVIEMRDGPELIFGDATRVRAKWLAATRVLADPDAQGASYIDVRLPGRPAAGGLPATTLAPVAPAGTEELAPPTTPVPPVAGTADPATEQMAPAPITEVPPTTPQSVPQAAPQSPQPTPPPADTTGAGGALAPPG
jgi:cell division protein FtsQ